MPGHKGVTFLGPENMDITEICGADVLYSPDGIIEESENNASLLFGSDHTYYSAEGSTLAIKAMLRLATEDFVSPLILAARNVHKSFINACALLDIDVKWIVSKNRDHLCSCNITPEELESSLDSCPEKPCAVYVTSPDYMGNILDISAISEVCHRHGIPLLVDNAHGAYLAFTKPSMHPLSLGADICCDSAHKTLPVLTGGAYLHVSKSAPPRFANRSSVRSALSLFASTSPSYLILQSLDVCNKYLSDGYRSRLGAHIRAISDLKETLTSFGYTVLPSEPLKIVIDCNKYGYKGSEISGFLRENRIECEFSDDQYTVLMTTPENSEPELNELISTLLKLKARPAVIPFSSGALSIEPRSVISIREAILSRHETVRVDDAEGRICAAPSVSCPPAVPIAVSGEVISRDHIALFKEYGIDEIEICIK